MQSILKKILKDGERKGYFRLRSDGAKIEYLPSGHKENLNDHEEKVRAEYLKQIRIVLADKAKQEKITSGVQSSYSKMRTLHVQAAEVLEST